MSRRNLTQLEIPALVSSVNVADGHPRQRLTPAQQRIVDDLPELFAYAGAADFEELYSEAIADFLGTLGQHSAVEPGRRVLAAYSSSVAIAVLGRALRGRTRDVALLHPTFDNIADLLRGCDLRLHPVTEAELAAGDAGAVRAGAGALFVTMPNNPTGLIVPPQTLRSLGELCATHGAILAIDASFRGFDERATYDNCEVLDDTGAEYVIIEDTGKLWPVQELKLGLLVASASCRLPLERGLSDVLLSVSPLVLALVSRLATDARDGGLVELRDLIGRNRALVRGAVEQHEDIRFVDPDARVSVCRVELPEERHADAVQRTLRERGVHLLPGGPFYWANPDSGSRIVRLALARNQDLLETAVTALIEELTTPSSRRLPSGSVA